MIARKEEHEVTPDEMANVLFAIHLDEYTKIKPLDSTKFDPAPSKLFNEDNAVQETKNTYNKLTNYIINSILEEKKQEDCINKITYWLTEEKCIINHVKKELYESNSKIARLIPNTEAKKMRLL